MLRWTIEDIMKTLMQQKCFVIDTPEKKEMLRCFIEIDSFRQEIPRTSLIYSQGKYVVEYNNYNKRCKREFSEYYKAEVQFFQHLKELPSIERFLCKEHKKEQKIMLQYKSRDFEVKVKYRPYFEVKAKHRP